ncbi:MULTISPECIES: helix-turn-helix domain-containing protein [Bradyrhizobium]|nr:MULTISPECIES: helix-turn-helix domain-containing protein [Bradyrhizobium]MCG2628272.1 helix-turn-helix domain-containing protein [Bradyrhizobium zhengyangense]MCG2643391.1 helix-turn-helix domain-containing protein [Bradyrhizobium zhengyangense]MCG2670295.1 helix-turn-helix domain-containing protein [Bradyrhizobium zhengyangense]MDN4985971.1 helix-turn-helix domain-containing protein [Bradyrhizobium sp. WYCCWR 13022]MDN5002649.1 helix-turn-helix domain-containing protein [Bradyrhizobium sp.
MSDVALEKIESGEATATEARSVISEFLKEGSESSLERIYATLGAWLWNSLESRRRDPELREWFDILRRVSASLAPKNAAYAERFRAFYDLLQMSINTAKVARPSEVMHRQHVVEILRLLRDAPSRQLEKTVIAKKLDLKDANLSRILRLMTNARFVERTAAGKFAHFALTRDGLMALERHEGPTARGAGQLAQLMRRKMGLRTHPALTAEENVVLRSLFDLPSPMHPTLHAAGLVMRDPLGVRQVMEDYLLHPPAPTAPGYMKARTKSSYHGSSVTVVQVKKAEGHGASTSIEAVNSPKPVSFPSGMLHLSAGEDSEHVE